MSKKPLRAWSQNQIPSLCLQILQFADGWNMLKPRKHALTQFVDGDDPTFPYISILHPCFGDASIGRAPWRRGLLKPSRRGCKWGPHLFQWSPAIDILWKFYWHCGIQSDIYSHMYSDILSHIYSDILARWHFTWHMFWHSIWHSSIPSDIYSDISADILLFYATFYLPQKIWSLPNISNSLSSMLSSVSPDISWNILTFHLDWHWTDMENLAARVRVGPFCWRSWRLGRWLGKSS